MKNKIIIIIVLVIYIALLSCADKKPVSTPVTSDRFQWFKEARFGMFVHWGPYSSLAGEWQGKRVPVGQNAEWIMKQMRIPATEYRKMAAQFNPVKFNADEWVALAKNAGMKYLVVTAKHHDGFAMYHSQVSDYNIVDYTAFGRDPLAELAAACEKAGIRFCVYYSHREDWDDPDGYGNDWDYVEADKNFNRYLEEKSIPQMRELLTNYGPLGLVWFDRGMYTREQGQTFVDLVHELQPACLINGRVGSYDMELQGDYQEMSDNGIPLAAIDECWETPQTLNHTWGYSKYDHEWKTPEEVIHRMVEIASRGGNYLLNIGPKGDGSIPVETVDILTHVGAWMQQNSASIYGTTASPCGEFPWGLCTVKDTLVYLHVFEWPVDGQLHFSGLENTVVSAYLLSDKSTRLAFSKTGDDLVITLPAAPVDDINTVIVLHVDGAPVARPQRVTMEADNHFMLDYMTARVAGKAIKRFNRKGGFYISGWSAPQDSVLWTVDISLPGIYRVCVTGSARVNGEYTIRSESGYFTAAAPPDSGWYNWTKQELGIWTFDSTGVYHISISPAREHDHDMMYLKDVQLWLEQELGG